MLFLCSVTLLAAAGAHASWVANGDPVAVAPYDQHGPEAVSDGAGGVILVWGDNRNTPPYNGIYAQRLDGWGNALWTSNGTPVYANGFLSYYSPAIAPDGAGGAIVIWSDNRNGGFDLFAQRIDAAGIVQWTAGGVLICNRTSAQKYYAIIPDGAGGAIVAWQDSTLDAVTPSADIFAQKIDASGSPQWTAGGVAVCTNMFEQYAPCLASDGTGGAIIAWDDHRGGPGDIYAQRIDASGAAAWTANGKVICNAVNAQQDRCIVTDDVGSAIVAWRDFRDSSHWLIYAQRIDRSGNVQWASNGVLVNTTAANMYHIAIASDGWNGAIVAWSQSMAPGQDIYAQRMSYLGYRQWNNGGNIVCDYSGTQDYPIIVADGNRGAVLTWHDSRSGTPNKDLYAQKISYDGVRQWNANGVAVCAEGSDQAGPCIASDGSGGAFFAWQDYRNEVNSCDLYAQRIEGNGYWGYPSPTITSVADVPDDQGGLVNVTWEKTRLERITGSIIDRYSVWRMLPAAQLSSVLAAGGKGVDPANLSTAAPGEIFISRASGAATGWELLEYIDATFSDTYTAEAATLFDSTAADPGRHYFMVMAHATDHFLFWQSEPDSGCSVDNIEPAQPSGFSGSQSFDPPGLSLTWGPGGGLRAPLDDDFSHYALYRDVLPDFERGPGNRIYEGTDTEYFDGDWRWDSGFYYMLSAVDIHGNESGAAYLGPEGITDAETPDAPAVTYLAQNAPNPFNPATAIPFGLAAPGRVTLSIYDVSGRLIRTLVDETRSAGLYRETWNGRNEGGRSVASGIYFYRLRAGTFNETKKMVLAR
jgi:hypothetical protein